MPKKKRVLVVDDDREVRETLCYILDLNDFELHSAAGGGAAFALLQEKSFDVIISDYSMPGMNGAELVSRMRSRCPRSFIVGISGDCREGDFLEAGANAFLRKPINPEELVSLILSGIKGESEIPSTK